MKKRFDLTLDPLELGPHEDHIATSWQVSTTKNFSDVICESLNDKVHKMSKKFYYDVIPGKKYWAACRVLTSSGWSEWSNFDMVIPKTIKDVPGREFLPSTISSPCVTTDSVREEHSPIGFTIKTKDFGTKGDATHVSTSWFIEKLSGEVVWKRMHDTINKYQIFVSDIFLNVNSVYRIKAIFHSSSYDSSVISTYTIRTGDKSQDVNILRLTELLEHIDFESGADIKTQFVKHEGVDDVEVSIYSYNDTASELVYKNTFILKTRMNPATIPSHYFKKNEIYVVFLKYNNREERIYNIFNTYGK